jgi:protein TonB
MTRTLSDRSRRMLASCLGTLLLIILLLLVSMEGGFEVERLPEITVREVRMYTPPPPPPPPPMEQNTPSLPMPSLTRANVEDPVELDVMELEVDMEAVGISGFGTGGPGGGGGLGGGGGGGWGTWGTVALSELDNIPMVRSAPLLAPDDSNPLQGLPKEAIDQNILEFEVLLHIIIDEEGRTYPVGILRNPFPSMNEEIMKFAAGVLFTPPTKGGGPVRTEYAWPLLIKMP